MIPIDPRLLSSFTVFDVDDPGEMDTASRVSRRFPSSNNANTYVLRDRGLLLRPPGDGPLTRLAMRPVDDLLAAYVSDRHGTEVGIVGAGTDRFCLTTMLAGEMELRTGATGTRALARPGHGLLYRGEPGTGLVTSDGNARFNLWIEAERVERALHGLLGGPERGPLVFAPAVDWSSGLGASLHAMLQLFTAELARPDGLASNAVALRSFTDALVQTMLQGLPHSLSERLRHPRADPVPRHLRRAEEHMHAHADRAMGLQDVADAAGCSLRALHDAFRRFRGLTPLAALHGIRLDRVRAELARGEAPVMDTARRFGFTNRGRFVLAYARRFGEPPPGARRRP